MRVAAPPSCSVCSPPRDPSGITPPRVNGFYSSGLRLVPSVSTKIFPRIYLRCNCTGDSDENQSRTVLDAFFLGKAVAEAVNERIESAVGEFLSTIGRLQAEQQKQVQEFQEDVLERARQAKEQAAREAMETRGGLFIPNSSAGNEKSSTVNGVASASESNRDSSNAG